MSVGAYNFASCFWQLHAGMQVTSRGDARKADTGKCAHASGVVRICARGEGSSENQRMSRTRRTRGLLEKGTLHVEVYLYMQTRRRRQRKRNVAERKQSTRMQLRHHIPCTVFRWWREQRLQPGRH